MNKSEYPLFSVIIPQKNRAEYLEATIRSCMSQDYPNFQIVVSDDCSDDNSVEVANKLAEIDSRIKVFAHQKHIGMHDNFEFALNQVTEGYVIALGGDDGLTPGCIWRMHNILKESGRQLLTWIPASFYYPENNNDEDDCLLIVRRKRAKYKIIKSAEFLQGISKTFRYQIDECPMFYVKGVASIDLVNRVKQRTKDHCFYYCPTPDGYSGVVLAGEVEDYVLTYEPLSIMGTTSKSQGKNYRRNDQKSRFESTQFFNDSIRRTMHEQLDSQPYSPIVTLMTADYLLTAKDLPGWPAHNEYEVSIKNLIEQTFSFISQSYYTNETLVRELIILYKIAEKHNMLDLYRTLYKSTRKKVMKGNVNKEFTITRSLRFAGRELKVKDIYGASLAIPFIYNFVMGFNIKLLFKGYLNGIRVLLDTRKYKWESLPEIDYKEINKN